MLLVQDTKQNMLTKSKVFIQLVKISAGILGSSQFSGYHIRIHGK